MLAIDARLLLDELLEDASQVLNLQQSLLVLDIASNRKGVRIDHQFVQLLLQMDLVLELLVRLHRQSLLLLATNCRFARVVIRSWCRVEICSWSLAILLLALLGDRDGLCQ